MAGPDGDSKCKLLDEWHGFHPHTTWATVTPRGLVAELAAAGHDPYVLGLTRTYATRHGAGPMPTEDAALDLPEPDNGPGLYQGNWRVGHLDLPRFDTRRRSPAASTAWVSHTSTSSPPRRNGP